MIVSRYHDISCGHVVSGHTGKCGNLHGHNYRIYFHCAGLVSGDGMVIDFADIKSGLCGWLESNWDHRFLVWDRDPIYADLKKIDGTVCGVPFNPTAENMAQYLIDVVGPMALPSGITLQSVVVEETRKCSAVVSVQPGQDSAQGALKDAVIVALRAWMAAENGHVDDWPNLIDALAELDSGTRSEDDD